MHAIFVFIIVFRLQLWMASYTCTFKVKDNYFILGVKEAKTIGRQLWRICILHAIDKRGHTEPKLSRILLKVTCGRNIVSNLHRVDILCIQQDFDKGQRPQVRFDKGVTYMCHVLAHISQSFTNSSWQLRAPQRLWLTCKYSDRQLCHISTLIMWGFFQLGGNRFCFSVVIIPCIWTVSSPGFRTLSPWWTSFGLDYDTWSG